MKCEVDRRSFLLGSAAAAGAACLASALPWASRAMAAAAPTTLTIERRTIEVKGRAASVFGIRQPNGISGLVLDPGQPFHIDLVNGIGEDTIVHWHGQKPPYRQDGVADRNIPLIAAGKSQGYDYRPTPGTHWMHSHRGLQEQALLAAPLIVHSAEDLAADVQEVTVLLHDFSFRQPEEILAGLTGGAGGHDMEGMVGMPDMAGMDHSGMGHSGMGDNGMAMPMTMDLNDVEYDAFLANDRTLDDPLVVRVERSGRARLRIINGAASSAFWIELGGLRGTLVAVDGNPVVPVAGSSFPIAIAQRLDLIVDVPTGAFPVLAQVEGKTQRTGFILASPGAAIAKVADVAAVHSRSGGPFPGGAAAGVEPAPGPFPGCSPYHGADGIDGALPLGNQRRALAERRPAGNPRGPAGRPGHAEPNNDGASDAPAWPSLPGGRPGRGRDRWRGSRHGAGPGHELGAGRL